jgi:hypothetical protein
MRTWWIPVTVLAIAIGGCSDGKKDTKGTEQTGAQVQQHAEMPPPIQPPKPAETKPPETAIPKPAETKPTLNPAARPAATGPVTKVVKLPAGYEFQVVLDEKVSTETHRAGTPFQAKLVQPAVLSTVGPVFPVGSKIRGEITFSQRAERVGGKADLTLEYRELVTPDGKSYPLFTEPLILEGKGTAKGDIEKTVGGAVGGAIIGGVLGGKKGALEGGAAGGAAGAVWAVATRGNDVVIDPGQVLQVTLTRALHVTALVQQ